MNPLRIVVAKEIRDNLRDRRSLFFSLLFAPVLLPTLMFGSIVININRYSIDPEQPRSLPVAGAEHAPELIDYLKTRNLDAAGTGGDYAGRVRRGELALVLEIPPSFPAAFANGDPAPLVIHYNSGEHESTVLHTRLKSELDRYAARIRGLRYLARGIDEQAFTPFDLAERDLSDEVGREAVIALILPFVLLMAMTTSGLYLASDTTAGERERLSLEPLLALPVERLTLVLGKYVATLAFVATALILPLIISFTLIGLSGDKQFLTVYNYSPAMFAIAAGLHLPVALAVTAWLLFLGAYARSTKEAQTLMGLTNVLPVLPFFALQFMDVPQNAATVAAPFLGQFQVMERLITGQTVPPTWYAASIGGALIATALLLAATVRLYSRESILQ